MHQWEKAVLAQKVQHGEAGSISKSAWEIKNYKQKERIYEEV